MNVIVEIGLFCGDDSEFQAFQRCVYQALNKCVKPSEKGMMYNCLLKCQRKAKGRAVSKSRERVKMVSSGTILFFHDVGDNGDKWAKRLGTLFPGENIRIFCPTASEMPVGLYNGLCMHSWFNMSKDHDPMEGEIWDIKKSAKFVKHLIDFEILHGTPLDRIILGGHSQGGALALYAGLSYGNKTTDKNLGGIFTLGSWLLLPWEFDSAYAQSIIAANAPKNVLMCHGERDRKIPSQYPFIRKCTFLLSFCLLCETLYLWKRDLSFNESAEQLRMAFYNPSQIFQESETRVIGKSTLLPSMDQFDVNLHELIQRNHVIQPTPRALPYSLSHPSKDPSMGQGQSIRNLFKNMTNGFFIECGALDGETRSNTLGLERDLQWTGILIEGDPNSIPKILSKCRKSYVVPHCLATKNMTMKVSYGSFFNLGRIVDESSGKEGAKVVDVTCLPLYAILMALKVTQVDYFSLDVEGSELEVLKTIPWDKVNILALSVEVTHIGKYRTKGTKSELESFMESKGYQTLSKVTNRNFLANDIIFGKKGFFENVSLLNVASR